MDVMYGFHYIIWDRFVSRFRVSCSPALCVVTYVKPIVYNLHYYHNALPYFLIKAFFRGQVFLI